MVMLSIEQHGHHMPCHAMSQNVEEPRLLHLIGSVKMERSRIDTEAEEPRLLHLNCFQALRICTEMSP